MSGNKALRVVVVLTLAMCLFCMPAVASTIDWRQAEGETIALLLNKHTYTDSLVPHLNEFTQLTGIKVEPYVLSEQQFWEKQRIVLSTHSDEYDITMMGPLTVWEYVDFLEPLNKYMEDPKLTDTKAWDKDDFFKGLMESNSLNGNQYAIPVMSEVYMLQYRKDLFDKFGLKIPKSTEEYVETARTLSQKLKEAGMDNIDAVAVRGIRSPGMVSVGYSNIFYSYGAKDFDENGKFVANSPEGIKATQLYMDLIKVGASKDWSSYDWYDVKDALTSGRAAMAHDCNFFAAEQWDPEISNVVGKMAYAKVPTGPVSDVSTTWTWGLSLNGASRHKKASWLFIQWATSKEKLLNASVNYNNFDPTRGSVWDDPKVVEMFEGMGN
ncbi:MAG: ABC transporter substrate-binding protein, partial [Limnochordia bacterium]